jgi:hypothetical protein
MAATQYAQRLRATDAFLDKIAPEPNSGCWIWLGSRNAFGYGQMWRETNGRCISTASCTSERWAQFLTA